MSAERRIAYFTMEVGLKTEMPTYSGGLGVLSGDTLRSAADLDVPLVAVTLLYRQGYFRQHLDAEGSQTETAPEWDPKEFLEAVDTTAVIELDGRQVRLRPWLYRVQGAGGAELPLYMLDADLPENDPEDRRLTGQLYGGDQRYRLRQEALLGLGGVAILRALGYDHLDTFHMNEGHSALLTLALLAEVDGGPAFTDGHVAAVRSRCVFTTHTPVAAGHDRFPKDMVRGVLGERLTQVIEELPLGEEGVLNMTTLGLYFSRRANAVSRRHLDVARQLFPQHGWSSITNGVHAATWVSGPMADLFDERIPDWRTDTNYLRQALEIPVEDILSAHQRAKRQLLDEVALRSGVRLDPSVFTIGFARRAAAYKRADLVFSQPETLRRIAREVTPLQFIYAGKAHPHDTLAKDLIRRVVEAGAELGRDVPVVYVEEHDMALGRLLCAGVDVWLNNPEKPLEASGTSGMKAALNGVPSLSVLDGWWPEGWIEGVTGWSIGDQAQEIDAEQESFEIYNKLCYVLLPLFHGSRSQYGRVMRSAIALNGSYFTTQRMLQQYTDSMYRAGPAEA